MADTNHFRKKPVVIQAIQWDGTLSGMDSILSSFNDIRTVAKTSHPPTNTCSFWKIGTLEGAHEVSAGDFIIRGVKGEYYPCKPDIFSMTYEPAPATPPADAALADVVDKASRSFRSAGMNRMADDLGKAAAALRARAVPDDVALNDARWRALIGCRRIRLMGCAGVHPDGTLMADRDGQVHFGAEFWTHYDRESSQVAINVITAFADAMLAASKEAKT